MLSTAASAVLEPVSVSVELMPATVGMSDAGENAQVTPAGWPMHVSAVEVLKPFCAVSVTGTVTELDCPGGGCGIVIAFVPSARVKSLMFTVKLAVFECAEFVPVTCTV